MKALVTGANGFIGSALVEELNRMDVAVRAMMRKTSDPSNLKGLDFERVEGNLADASSLEAAVKGVDWIFHLAGVTAAANREEFFKYNTEGTRHLAEATLRFAPQVKKFVYVSSLAAAGPAPELTSPVSDDTCRPVSHYGESKLAAEELLLEHANRLPLVIVRPPMVFGPKDRNVFLFIRCVARNLMPLLRGSNAQGQKFYSVVHAEDVCQILIQSAQSDLSSGQRFFVCSDGQYTYEEIMGSIAQKLGKRTLKLRIPKVALVGAAEAAHFVGLFLRKSMPLNRDKLNELLPDYWICSNKKAQELLGFKPKYDLHQGMNQTIDWYLKNGWI